MMLTRRNALMGAITAGAVMRTRTGFTKASQPATQINFDVPENACDCHTHIHADPQQFPFSLAASTRPNWHPLKKCQRCIAR
jgi:hypothetical protein